MNLSHRRSLRLGAFAGAGVALGRRAERNCTAARQIRTSEPGADIPALTKTTSAPSKGAEWA